MSLLTLPNTGYTYLSIESNNADLEWNAGPSRKDNAQFWVDVGLDEGRYVIAKWWKFWKPAITFKVFACGDCKDFSQIVRVQEK